MGKTKKYPYKKFVLFLCVGIINTVIGGGTMFILFNLCGWTYWTASAANYIVGGICSFFLNKVITFKDNGKATKQIIPFILNLLICYFIAYYFSKDIIFALLNDRISIKIKENIAMLVGMGVYTILNFLGQHFFIFNKNKNNP
ncbi:MAG: GtrA family protein [Paludibacteraceae bacterium]|nr:GtrA family protein [Paludibacteraceae bacterium]